MIQHFCGRCRLLLRERECRKERNVTMGWYSCCRHPGQRAAQKLSLRFSFRAAAAVCISLRTMRHNGRFLAWTLSVDARHRTHRPTDSCWLWPCSLLVSSRDMPFTASLRFDVACLCEKAARTSFTASLAAARYACTIIFSLIPSA